MFQNDIDAVTQQGKDLFDELSIPYLLDVPEEVLQQIRRWYASGYACGFGAGQRDVVDVLDRLTTPQLPRNTAGQTERQSR